MSDAGAPLVGRRDALGALNRALDAAATGYGFLALVGEPGAGKTRLLNELADGANARKLPYLAGRAAEFEQEMPFGAVVDALDDRLEDDVPDLSPTALRLLGTVFPALADRVAGTGAAHAPDGAADPVARRAELVDEYTEQHANPYNAAERGYVDDVIDPAETRRKLIAGLRMLKSKREELPRLGFEPRAALYHECGLDAGRGKGLRELGRPERPPDDRASRIVVEPPVVRGRLPPEVDMAVNDAAHAGRGAEASMSPSPASSSHSARGISTCRWRALSSTWRGSSAPTTTEITAGCAAAKRRAAAAIGTA